MKPVITGRKLTLGGPDNNALKDFAPVYFTWTGLGAGVEGYSVHLRRTDIEADEVVKRTTGTAISLDVAEGATYEWYVTAHGDARSTSGISPTSKWYQSRCPRRSKPIPTSPSRP